MSQEQYSFLQAESELPGLVAQYAKVVVGGLLRKRPQLSIEGVPSPEDTVDWLRRNLTAEGASLVSFLDNVLYEEVSTSRVGVWVDYPEVAGEEETNLKPYPLVWPAESIINWQTSVDVTDRRHKLSRVVLRFYQEVPADDSDLHTDFTEYVKDLHLDEAGLYCINTYKLSRTPTEEKKEARARLPEGEVWELDGESVYPMVHGERLTFIPFWFLNGAIEPIEPILSPLVDREVALYNKMTRRNHLLYTASTFTPVIHSTMSEDDFQKIVSGGLGSWILLHPDDKVSALETPTAALSSLDTSIDHTVNELAKMGIRMLAPESGLQSGVALEIRNSAQTTQLGTLNVKISETMKEVLEFMVWWGTPGSSPDTIDVTFNLSMDFNPTPLGEGWMRMITEWYQERLISRSTWIEIARQNDILPDDYNDDTARVELDEDVFLPPPFDYSPTSEAVPDVE